MNLLTRSKQVIFVFIRKNRTSVFAPQIVKAMKLTFVFLTIFFMQISARGISQKVTLSLKDAPVEKVFKEIEKQTGYGFLYSKKMFENAPKVSIKVKSAPLDEVLKECLKGQSLTYSIQNNTIVITQMQNSETASSSPLTITVRGTVKDEQGRPIQSVSVVVPGTPYGSMTNAQGEYSISDVPEKADLLFSYIGYESQRIPIKSRSVINVVLKTEVKQLDETVIIGYGKTTKRLNTGSTTTITSDVIEKQPVQNVMEALVGRVPGMQITQNNGLPGSNTAMQIHGQGSINSGTIPLYVIDGVPYTNFNGGFPPQDNLDAWGISGANGGTSPFSTVNPADIESITVLKDADATAIYGARGANGVVLITTKKGKSGKGKLDFNVYSGIGKVGHWIPMLNTQQYLALRREAYKNDGVDPASARTRPVDLLDWDQNAYTDWQKFLLGGTAHSSNADIAYSGGNATTSFRLSGSFRHDGTVYPGDWRDNRATSRFSLSHHSINNKFGFSFSASYAYENNKLPPSDISGSYTLPPNYPSKLKDDSTGKLIWYAGFTNPLSYLEQTYNAITTNVMGNFSVHYTVLPGLDLKVNSGYTNVILDAKKAVPALSQNPSRNPASTAYFSTDKAQNWIIEPTATYELKTRSGKLNALIGGTFQQNISDASSVKATNYTSDLLLGSLNGAGLITNYFPNYAQYNFASLYGRVNYSYQNKYVLDATYRRDGSSRFGANNRFGNFWAVGGAWIFSDEQFMKDNVSFLSFGKLRASYGLTGNDQISDYQYLPLYSTISNPYQNQIGLYEVTTYNPDIQWETDKKLELALELGFLKNRIMLTGDYYKSRSGNLLDYMILPSQTGHGDVTSNMPAVIQNTGLELTLNTKNIVSKNFEWTTSFNITIPKNKLLSYHDLEKSFYGSTYAIGQPINLTRLYDFTGIDAQTGAPRYATKDASGIPNYNTDRTVAPIGTVYYGGLSNDFTYKQWSFSFFLEFSHQYGYINSVNTPLGASMTNANTSVLNRWQQPGDANTLFPAASATPGSAVYNAYGYYYSSSDALWGDASWLKIRNAALSYSFNSKILKQLGLSALRLYSQAQNLITFDKDKYRFDPETSVPGGGGGIGTGRFPAVPPLRTLVFGINVSF